MRGRPAFKSRLIGLGKRCEVTAYTPTLEMQNIADERTSLRESTKAFQVEAERIQKMQSIAKLS